MIVKKKKHRGIEHYSFYKIMHQNHKEKINEICEVHQEKGEIEKTALSVKTPGRRGRDKERCGKHKQLGIKS